MSERAARVAHRRRRILSPLVMRPSAGAAEIRRLEQIARDALTWVG